MTVSRFSRIWAMVPALSLVVLAMPGAAAQDCAAPAGALAAI